MLIRKENIPGPMTYLMKVIHHQDAEHHYFEEYYPDEGYPEDLMVVEIFVVKVYWDASGYYLVRVDHVTPMSRRLSEQALDYFHNEFKPALFQELGTDNMAIYIDSLGHKTYICELPH